jgi:ABC-type glycerol-3-phosphate transport system substrate-binding protein
MLVVQLQITSGVDHKLRVQYFGNDPNATFAQFLIAYGGNDIVTPDGRFHGDDKQVQDAVIRSIDKLSQLYKDGHIPPSSINWNDADDNNAFHSKLCVMDFDGTLSTELAMLGKQKDEYNDVVTMPPQLDNDGRQMITQMGIAATMIPKGAKNIEVAKDLPIISHTTRPGRRCAASTPSMSRFTTSSRTKRPSRRRH